MPFPFVLVLTLFRHVHSHFSTTDIFWDMSIPICFTYSHFLGHACSHLFHVLTFFWHTHSHLFRYGHLHVLTMVVSTQFSPKNTVNIGFLINRFRLVQHSGTLKTLRWNYFRRLKALTEEHVKKDVPKRNICSTRFSSQHHTTTTASNHHGPLNMQSRHREVQRTENTWAAMFQMTYRPVRGGAPEGGGRGKKWWPEQTPWEKHNVSCLGSFKKAIESLTNLTTFRDFI